MMPKWYYILWNRLAWISVAVFVLFLLVTCILAFIFHIYVSGGLYWWVCAGCLAVFVMGLTIWSDGVAQYGRKNAKDAEEKEKREKEKE